jgi:hypothetical protein
MAAEQVRNLSVHGLRQKRSRAVAQNLSQRIAKSSWLRELENISLGHSVSPLCWRSGGIEYPHDTPPYPFTPCEPLGGRERPKLPFKARPEMREELPMDYIDLLKRVAIPLGTIMVLSSALAQEQLTKADLVQLAVTLGVYDNRCEKLAPRLLADVLRMVRMLDKDDVMAAVINEQDKVDRAGEAKWCDALRPVVEKYKDGLFEPVR